MADHYKLRGEIPHERILEAQVDEVLTKHREPFDNAIAQQLARLGVDPNSPTQVAVAAKSCRRVISEHGSDIVVNWFYGKTWMLRVYWHRGGERIFVDQPTFRKPKA